MNRSLSWKGVAAACLLLSSSLFTNAQSVTASPQNIIRPFGPATVSVLLDRVTGNWGNSGNYTWTVSPTTGVSIGSYSQSGGAAGDVTVTFSAAATGSYTFTLTRGARSASVIVQVGNLSATIVSGSTNTVAAFSAFNGVYGSGPGPVFTPAVASAALGQSASGHFYYLPNTYTGNDGNITVYAANPNGTGNMAIASADMNGASSNDLGFVRLAIDAAGKGWILAGDNNQLYLASFPTNGTNATTVTIVDPSVTLVNGTASTFFNGDICFSGNGTLYALANSSTGGVTQIFVGTPNGANTSLTKKWDLTDPDGNAFTGSVNGVAFDAAGSLYISTSAGLYFIDQYTINTGSGTVQCKLVHATTGLTDLASNYYPQQSTLPVQLLNFSGAYHQQKTILSWETAAEDNLDRFEIERNAGTGYQLIGSEQATGNSAVKQSYQLIDNLAAVNGQVFNYRLKMIDKDGQFRYSSVILIRRETTGNKELAIFPVPVTGSSTPTLRFKATRSAQATIHVTDLGGKIVLQQQTKLFEGSNNVSLNNSDRLPSGVYVLQLISDGQVSSLRFSVQR